MPADLGFSVEKKGQSLENELRRWLTEFQIRPSATFRQEVEDIAERVETPEQDSLEAVSEAVTYVKKEEPVMDRLPVLHLSRENLNAVNSGQLPEGFDEEFSEVVTGYLDGFIPEQKLDAPEKPLFPENPHDEKAGSYSFRNDNTKVYPKFGTITDGTPAATVQAHEIMHKNNNEAILEEPEKIRNLAQIYRIYTPEMYREFIQERPVAPVKEDLLGGLGLAQMDERYDLGIMEAYMRNEREEIDFEEEFGKFKLSVQSQENEKSLEYFDVRDETICQAVSFFMNGYFEQGFTDKLSDKTNYYNESSSYSEGAGNALAQNLSEIRKEYENREGLRGQRFKDTMEKRIPYLNGEETFNNY